VQPPKPNFRIFVPVFNEELNILRVIQDLTDYYERQDLHFIDDGSEDASLKILKQQKVNVSVHKTNQGIGAVLKTATKIAQELSLDFFVWFDGDGQHLASQISRLLTLRDFDLVIGSRFAKEDAIKLATYKIPLVKRVGILLLSKFIERKYHARIKDVTSGFRLYAKNTYDLILKMPEDFYLADTVETLHICLKNSLNVGEVSVVMRTRESGKSSAGIMKGILYYIKVVSLIVRRV